MIVNLDGLDELFSGGGEVEGTDPMTDEEIAHEGEIADVTIDPTTGAIVVIDEDGKETAYPEEKDEATGERKSVKIVDSSGDSWIVDKNGNVSKGVGAGDNAPNEITETDSVLFVQKELIKEVLQHYKKEINFLLENKDKGPLIIETLNRMLSLPDCLPETEEQLRNFLDRIEYFEENIEELINLVEKTEENKQRFNFLVNKLNGKQPPFIAELTDVEWEELLNMICPIIMPEVSLEGLIENEELVSLNSVPSFFKLEAERLEFTYSIADDLPLDYNKIEIFRVEGENTILAISFTNLTKGEHINFLDLEDQNKAGWAGTDENGAYVSAGEYLVKLTSTIDSEYANGYIAISEFTINPRDVSLEDEVEFFGYSSSDPTGCFRRASEMLQSAGYQTVAPDHEDVVQMTQANENDELQIQDQILDGIDLINYYLDNNMPVMVGVNYHDGHPGNLDQTTDHWVVIVGRTTTDNITCFRYYDAQTAHETIGTSTNNELCEQEDHTLTGVYREGSAYERTYTVTMVRPNENIND